MQNVLFIKIHTYRGDISKRLFLYNAPQATHAVSRSCLLWPDHYICDQVTLGVIKSLF